MVKVLIACGGMIPVGQIIGVPTNLPVRLKVNSGQR